MQNLLATNDGLVITEHGLQIKRQLNVDEWRHLMAQAKAVKNSYVCILADLTFYGRRSYGDEVVNDTVLQLEFDMADIGKAETIALISNQDRADFGLSGEHAYVLGSCLKSPEEREKWAALCQEHGLTAFELKKSIEKGEVVRAADITEQSGHTEGIPTIQAVQFQFQKWVRQFKDDKAVLSLPKKEKLQILKNLTPIIQLAAKLEASI